MKTQQHHVKVSLKLMMLISILIVISAGCRKSDLESKGTQEIGKLMSTGNARAAGVGLIQGINGHPVSQYAYNGNGTTISRTAQVNMIKEMRLSYYRVDVLTDADGKVADNKETVFLDIVAKCQAQGIKILPMIYDKCLYGQTPAQNYQRGKTQMEGFATKYGQYFEYYELGNEIELFDTLIRKKSTGERYEGDDAMHYYPEKVAVAEQYVRGMEEGLKSIDTDAKSMVNTAGYFPTYWMDRMFAVAPTIDICAWHLYSEMPNVYMNPDNYKTDNIHQFLYNRYGRPIWYTESNYKSKYNQSQETNELKAEEWRTTITQQCKGDPNVQALIFHELLDNPERSTGTNNYQYTYTEENYGFVKFNGYPGKADAAAYNAWRTDPNRYKNWSYKLPGATLVGPDLIVTDITWSPSNPSTGNTITFTAVIQNLGPAATPSGVIHGVSFKVDGRAAGCNGSTTASLAPGASRTLTGTACTKWTALAGSHTVVATVDDQYRFREKDEENNTRSETINVSN